MILTFPLTGPWAIYCNVNRQFLALAFDEQTHAEAFVNEELDPAMDYEIVPQGSPRFKELTHNTASA